MAQKDKYSKLTLQLIVKQREFTKICEIEYEAFGAKKGNFEQFFWQKGENYEKSANCKVSKKYWTVFEKTATDGLKNRLADGQMDRG